jgi:hypothetical protein
LGYDHSLQKGGKRDEIRVSTPLGASPAVISTPTTVKTHLKHLYEKLQVSTRRQAVAKGQALGLLTHR